MLQAPPGSDGQFKVGAAYGGAHGRIVRGDDREHCTCGWVSRPLSDGEQKERATTVWPGHLVLNGPWTPTEEFQRWVASHDTGLPSTAELDALATDLQEKKKSGAARMFRSVDAIREAISHR